ncbi:hypothetical protein K2173_020885 [Erythroxylum novogranatense]|uniref:Protein kinase domain-containing protein n=1 Tax=Erythroxylum novogranatense TaxID=1862640 RepID=A0AAV8TNX7_9ROSI|nr:hypothetical protein K2173_020885 [Erythroxylum novogranatense]
MGSCRFSLFCLITVLIEVSGQESPKLVKEKVSLLMFKSGVVEDPQGALETWNSWNAQVCNWTGVTCNNASDDITKLDLSGLSLVGRISSALANLSSLTILDLSMNFFQGRIPAEFGYLFQLKQISLSFNMLQGNVPGEFGSIPGLKYLDLSSNQLGGHIPLALFCNESSPLEYIDMSNNSLTGEIPLKGECKLAKLKYLMLWSNGLVGQVPQALANYSKLEWLDLETNMLSGELPSGVVRNLPHLNLLYLSSNNFLSHESNTNLEPFFASLVNLSSLRELELAGNGLAGEIPSIIGDLSYLVLIHIDRNSIYGSIPPEISKLVNLTFLNLSSNLLNGTIPTELCRMQRLERVYLSNNSLSGEIPSALGNSSHLGLLDLSKNKLSGSIPDSFANLSQLRRLLLYDNELSGNIPPSLGKCINLEILDLSWNRISGIIPSEVAALRSLKLYLNLSGNHLDGPIPVELSKMDMVLAIDLSSNNLSGTIPPQLGSCIALEHLKLSGNVLEGTLPASIGQLPYLTELDVSSNQLSGQIPTSLQASPTLKQLNFSFNRFSGSISNKGAFSFLTVDSFLGNNRLCGTISGMSHCRKKLASSSVIVPTLMALLAASLICFLTYYILRWSKIRRQLAIFNREDVEEEANEAEEFKYPKVSYLQLIEATGGFSASNLIGWGRFGHVYKGVLQDNTKIAVKVLNLKKGGEISDSFKRECQVLKRARHRNLIRIITICSKPDFKALVLPLASNGSLERHLYPNNGLNSDLDLVQLVSICSDVAEGISYLHHFSPVRVMHCDLKPSNILLDDDMTALVTDFGISKLVKGVDEYNSPSDSVSFSSTNDLLCGSIGYIPPEYGIGKRASTQGDVYSYGVILLEIITGGDQLIHYPSKLNPIIQQAILRCSSPIIPAYFDGIWSEVIVELIELGLMCTQHNPSTRPSMLDVAQEMGRLKEYVSSLPSLLNEKASSNPGTS